MRFERNIKQSPQKIIAHAKNEPTNEDNKKKQINWKRHSIKLQIRTRIECTTTLYTMAMQSNRKPISNRVLLHKI